MEIEGTKEVVGNDTINTNEDIRDVLGTDCGEKDDIDAILKAKNEDKKAKKRPKTSEYWDHFDGYMCEKDRVQKAKCKYCSAVIKADPKKHGTKPLKNHYQICNRKPRGVDPSQARVSCLPAYESGKGTSLVNWKYDQTKTRNALCSMLVMDELPFKTVEHPGFRHFMSIACPMFPIPSRRTITRDIYNMYLTEMENLKSFLQQHAQRVSLTTDTWTSLQKVNYMSLTAHFVDNDWRLQKRILNFCPIWGHKAEEIGKCLENCLVFWGIEKVFAITVDNASSNDGAIAHLQRKFDIWGTSILGGKYVHMRCVAHIINLIVQDGLKSKDEHMAICRIRGAIKYIKNSPARYQRFKDCIHRAKIDSKKLLCLDVPTRWNSTYLMLEAALSLKKAFDAYEDADRLYVIDLSKSPYEGVPMSYDWDRADLLVKFLEHFYRLTLRISGSNYVTSNVIFQEINAVEELLKQWLESDDFELREMSKRMREKFDKYWGSLEKMNMVLFYAVILDPRHKFEFLEFSLEVVYGDSFNTYVLKENIRSGLQELFEEYKLKYGTSSCLDPTESLSNPICSNPVSSSLVERYKLFKTGGKKEQIKSELEKYLGEEVDPYCEDFDILNWWKVNSQRFPILSKMARDILAIPVSTVASEAAFSTGGRVLDAFRSSLSPKIVQALVCTQDWLRKGSKSKEVEENYNDIEEIEQELSKIGDASTIDI